MRGKRISMNKVPGMGPSRQRSQGIITTICKCSMCEKLHEVEMAPPPSGIMPRLYCPSCKYNRHRAIEEDRFVH